MAIPSITEEDVNAALKRIDDKLVPEGNPSLKYDLVKNDRKYPPKYVIAVAIHIATGAAITTDGFNAFEARKRLEGLNFQVEPRDVIRRHGGLGKEQKESEKYGLKPISGTKDELVELTLDNVGKVEAMIAHDSAYLRASDPEAGPSGEKKKDGTLKYTGSTPFWMLLLKKVIDDSKGSAETTYGADPAGIGFTFKEIIAGAIVAVDRDNSTHLQGDGIGRLELWSRICKIGPKGLKEYLQSQDGSKLVMDIASDTTPGIAKNRKQRNNEARKEFRKEHQWLFKAIKAKIKTKNGKSEFKSRTNQSFASKFCHNACFYVFEGKREQDNFSIYDKVLETVLPRYWKKFGITIPSKISGKFNYKEYCDAIDKLRNKSSKGGYKISRHGLDHLLWYYHKGRLTKESSNEDEEQALQ